MYPNFYILNSYDIWVLCMSFLSCGSDTKTRWILWFCKSRIYFFHQLVLVLSNVVKVILTFCPYVVCSCLEPSWTYDPVLVLGRCSIHTPGAHSAAIPLCKGITVHYLVFSSDTLKQKVLCLCTHVKSHLTLWKRVGPCGCWWWMTAH